jgi:hypothetical protein
MNKAKKIKINKQSNKQKPTFNLQKKKKIYQEERKNHFK